jgi:hypothetical protein
VYAESQREFRFARQLFSDFLTWKLQSYPHDREMAGDRYQDSGADSQAFALIKFQPDWQQNTRNMVAEQDWTAILGTVLGSSHPQLWLACLFRIRSLAPSNKAGKRFERRI